MKGDRDLVETARFLTAAEFVESCGSLSLAGAPWQSRKIRSGHNFFFFDGVHGALDRESPTGVTNTVDWTHSKW